MARRTTILIDDSLFTRLLKIQSEAILRTNSAVSLSSVINQIVAERVIPKKMAGLVIENVLLEISKKTMQDIGKRLYEKHQTYFADYLKNPDHLVDVLKEEFGSSYKSIIGKIDEKLKEHIEHIGQK